METKSRRTLRHQGTVNNIVGREVFVAVPRTSACGGCEVTQRCGLSETRCHVVAVPGCNDHFIVGEDVTVVLDSSKGFQAVFLGYILPFCVVVSALFIFSRVTSREALSGCGALLMLVPYYSILRLFRRKLQQSFQMKLCKNI